MLTSPPQRNSVDTRGDCPRGFFSRNLLLGCRRLRLVTYTWSRRRDVEQWRRRRASAWKVLEDLMSAGKVVNKNCLWGRRVRGRGGVFLYWWNKDQNWKVKIPRFRSIFISRYCTLTEKHNEIFLPSTLYSVTLILILSAEIPCDLKRLKSILFFDFYLLLLLKLKFNTDRRPQVGILIKS